MIILSFLFVIILGGAYSYSKYTSSISGTADADVADWNMKVNGCSIVTDRGEGCFEYVTNEDGSISVVKNYTISDFKYFVQPGNEDFITENKIAPGASGIFEIEIDPNATQVSFMYDLNVTQAVPNESIDIYVSRPNQVINLTNKTVDQIKAQFVDGIVTERKYGFKYNCENANGICNDNEIKYTQLNTDRSDSGTVVDIVKYTIFVVWNTSDESNYVDTYIGTYGDVPILEIPVEIIFNQVLG